jgi:hypothetical protein
VSVGLAVLPVNRSTVISEPPTDGRRGSSTLQEQIVEVLTVVEVGADLIRKHGTCPSS